MGEIRDCQRFLKAWIVGAKESGKILTLRKEVERMRLWTLLLVVLLSGLLAANVFAVPSTKTVEFPDGAQGKVVFSGKVHADKGLKCTDCHTKIWPMKKGQAMKMADINAGKFCGVCHNGQKAFSTSKPEDCAKCHKK
jgi:c(7)-type cytochrome triheme protein